MALSWTAAIAADAPEKKPWKQGWDRKQVKVFAYACTDGLLEPAVRDYNAAALDCRRNGQAGPEALNGGRCKPSGLLGDILKNRKEMK